MVPRVARLRWPGVRPARALNPKHLALLEPRLDELAGAGVLVLAGRPLPDAARLALHAAVERAVLPELYADPPEDRRCPA